MRLSSGVAAALLGVAIYFLNFQLGQADFLKILFGYAVGFSGFGYLSYKAITGKVISVKFVLILGVLLRLMLLCSFPNLSDDIYRFLWDGYLLNHGQSPFSMTPSDMMADKSALPTYLIDLYPRLNSPDYFSVYPPVSQWVYSLATMNEGWSIQFSSLVISAILLLSELGIACILIKILGLMGRNVGWMSVYFLNPLVIVETVGQLHFESIMVFFTGLCILFLLQKRWLLAGVNLAMAVGVKLWPLMFAPLIVSHMVGDRLDKEAVVKFLRFALGCGLTLIVLFIPMIRMVEAGNFFESVNLYFQSFEFNASIYYLVRWLGIKVTGYNQIAFIGPLLSLITVMVIMTRALKRERMMSASFLVRSLLVAFSTYLLLATTVHPWYLILPVFLTAIVRKVWVLVWSGVVVFSYSTYTDPDFQPDFLWISLEYAIVLAAYGVEELWIGAKKKASLRN